MGTSRSTSASAAGTVLGESWRTRAGASMLRRSRPVRPTRMEDVSALDASICEGLRRSLERSTSKVQQVRDMAAQVKGMADVQQELTIPLQGLPDLADGVFAACFIPERLPPPSTKWLHSIPPQRDVFGDNKPTWWCTTATQVGVLSSDGGTCLIDFVHSMRDWCYACLDGGGDPGGVRGPRTTVLGAGLFETLTLADGGGTAPACISIWECSPDGVQLFDWTKGFNSQFNAEDLIQWLGQGDDMRTLSILANGTLFLHPDADTPPPHHVRLMPNQASYGEAIEQMGEEIAQMAEKGHYSILDVCGRDETLTHDSPSPTSHLPSWNAPILGVDKPNGSKRRCMNKSAPHPSRDGEPVRERNKLHGKPDGAEVCAAQPSHRLRIVSAALGTRVPSRGQDVAQPHERGAGPLASRLRDHRRQLRRRQAGLRAVLLAI